MRELLISSSREMREKISPRCAESVARGIKNCSGFFSSNDTTNAHVCSIQKKVKKYFDGVLDEWIVANDLAPFPFPYKFSGILTLDRANADKLLQMWTRMVISLADLNSESEARLIATLGCIRDFLHLCYSFHPCKITVVRVDDDGCADVYKQQTGREEKLIRPLPSYLFFDNEHFCKLCFNPIESEFETERYLSGEYKNISDDALTLLKSGAKLIGNKIRQGHCRNHSRKDSFTLSNYNRDIKRKLQFYSVMRLIISVYEIKRVRPLSPEILRSHAHAIVYTDGHMPKPLKKLPSLLSDLCVSNQGIFDATKFAEVLMHNFQQIVELAKKKGYDPEEAQECGLRLRQAWLDKNYKCELCR